MDSNDDFYGKELNLNCFYMHTNFEQKCPETAIVPPRIFRPSSGPGLGMLVATCHKKIPTKYIPLPTRDKSLVLSLGNLLSLIYNIVRSYDGT